MSWFITSILLVSGLLLGYLTNKLIHMVRVRRAQQRADEILGDVQNIDPDQLEEVQQEKREIEEFREELTQQIEESRDRIQRRRERVESLEERFEGRQNIIEKISRQNDESRQTIEQLKRDREQIRRDQIERLEEQSDRSRDDILESMRSDYVSQARLASQDMIKRYETTTESERELLARHILDRSIARCGVTSPVQIPSAVLKFPDEDAYKQLKEFYDQHHDRLIEDLESDIRFDDENTLAVVETLKPVQKEIVHRTLNNIIQQKKFRYELVEKGLERYEHRVANEKNRAAREAVKACRVQRVSDRVFDLLGTLQFRTSYGQQQLVHSIEVAHLGSLMAHEIQADAETTRRAGLLHDIGKAIDRQRESGHAVIGAEIAEEEGEDDVVVNAIGSHHGDTEADYVESMLVAAADAISGSRPGARRENMTNYSERIESLLELARDRKGIQKVYAMSAGRELRIRVNREVIKDTDLENLARAIARDIEDQLTYSGEIKVNTIRETKIVRKATN